MINRSRHRVVVTGIGMSTSVGPDLPSCWNALVEGRVGIRPITFFDPSRYSVKLAAQVDHVPRDSGTDAVPRSWCRRAVRLFVSVADEAFRNAKLDAVRLPSDQIGISVGASVNYLDMRLLRNYFRLRRPNAPELDLARCVHEAVQDEGSFHRRQGDTFATVPAKKLGIAGPALVVDTACAASSHAIGEAYRLVKRGKVRAMLAGGSAALVSPFSILAFSLLGALSRQSDPAEASRPFDRLRDGFVMGEGAGAVLLESLESARERGARIYAEVVGFGTTLNAYNLTDPTPEGDREARAMTRALDEGHVHPKQVDYVAAHGTSTIKGDLSETRALRKVFKEHASKLLVSSNKGHLGHTISAAGVCNVICAVKSIVEGIVPPTMHLKHADPVCDLDYVPNQSRRSKIDVAVANAFAFGGQNAVLVVRAFA